MFDGNDSATTYFTSVAGINEKITGNDNIETIIRKLIKQVGDAAAAGVQSLTTKDDAWVTVDPDLNASTGAVTLKLAHGYAGTTSSSVSGDATNASAWGSTATVTIPTIGKDEKGHVSLLKTTTLDVVTLPSTPVTSLTTSGDAEVTATANTNATGDVTVSVAHTTHEAKKAGQTTDASLTINSSSFKVLEVSTNSTGHVISANARTITLPAEAFSDTTYTFASGIQSFTVTTNGGSTTTVNVNHQALTTGTATAADGKYISDVSIDTYGHVAGVASKTNGVYSDDIASHAANELAVWDGTNNKLKTSDKTIRNTDIADDSSATTIPTTAQVIKYVQDNKVAGAMTYKGTKATYADVSALTDKVTGDVWVLSTDDSTAKYKYQRGDMFIYSGTAWDRIPAGDTTVENKNATLQFGGDPTEVAVVDGTSITVGVAAETALNVTTDTNKETSGITYVSSVAKGTGSHDVTVKKADIRTATTAQTGIVQLTDSSVSTSTTTAVTPNQLKLVNDLAKTKSTVTYSQTVASTTADSYEVGKITIDGTETVIYGINKDTVYTHPKAPETGSVISSSAGTAAENTVVTSISRDNSGHIATVITSDITSAYNQRAINVNGAAFITTDNKTTALNLSAGTNVTLTTYNTTGNVTINAADEKVKATKAESESKIYLLGQTTTDSAAIANFDTSVYSEAGSLHAAKLYEESVSIHDSNSADWGTIS